MSLNGQQYAPCDRVVISFRTLQIINITALRACTVHMLFCFVNGIDGFVGSGVVPGGWGSMGTREALAEASHNW